MNQKKENNQLKKTDYANSLSLINNEPLMHYPQLKDSDITNSDAINKEEKQILLASLNFPKIRSLDIKLNNENHYSLVQIMGKAIWEMGITEKSMSQKEQEMFFSVAVEEIQNDFSNLSIEDIRIAFKKGARRHYGDFFQMSITTLNCWLKAYIEETKPSAILRLPLIKPIQDEKPKESKEEKLNNHKNWLENIYQKFEEYKKTKNYDYYDFNNNLYNHLKKIGLISLTAQQQDKIWNMAVKELKNDYHPKNGRNFGNRIDLKNIYEGLKLDEVDKKQYDLIVIRAKKISVKTYFTKLIKDDKNMKDVIEDAEKKYFEKMKKNENTNTNNNTEGFTNNSAG